MFICLVVVYSFQKESPYLEDFNYLIDLSFQKGMTWDKDIEDYFPNGTKCMNWQDVKMSHESSVSQVIISYEDIQGLIILLSIGLIAAAVILISERLTKSKKTSIREKKEILNKYFA